MIELQTIAEKIQNGLNSLTNDFVFKIFTNAQEYDEGIKFAPRSTIKSIWGIILPISGSTIVPIQGVNSYSIAYSIQFAVYYDNRNEIYNILSSYVQQNIGTSAMIDDYASVVNFDMPTVGQVEQFTSIGKILPISLTIRYQFIKGGKLSNDIKVDINGETMLVLSSAFLRARTPDTTWLIGVDEMQTAIGQQGLTINIEIAYTTGGNIVKSLASDIIAGKLLQTYNVNYNDGILNENWLAVLQDGSLNMEAQKVASISLSFLIARKDIYGEEL